MAGKNIEVAIERLNIRPHVRDGLRTIDQHARSVTMGHLHHFACWRDRAEGVRYLAERYDFRARAQQLLVLFEDDLAAIVDRRYAQAPAFFRTQLLPRHDVGVVLQPCDDDLVVFFDIAVAPTLGDEIDALGGAANKDDLAR